MTKREYKYHEKKRDLRTFIRYYHEIKMEEAIKEYWEHRQKKPYREFAPITGHLLNGINSVK